MYADFALQQLQCNQQGDFLLGCNPYLWVVLLRIDDDTLGSNPPVAAVSSLDPDAPRLVIKSGMRAGDTALVPDQVAYLAEHIRTDAAQRNLILITVLLDAHDTPWAAMAAGYSTFRNAAQAEVGSHLLELQSPDPQVRQDAIDQITRNINNQVISAIEAHLSEVDKIEIGAGIEVPDRVIANAFKDWEGVGPTSAGGFTLDFVHKTGTGVVTDDFVLSCQLVVNVDPCEAEVGAVRAVQQAIANINGRAKELINGQAHETPVQVEKELEHLEQELLQQEAKLAAAEAALAMCRAKVPAGPGGPVKTDPGA